MQCRTSRMSSRGSVSKANCTCLHLPSIPMGALATKKSEKEADGDAERVKKRKKSASESKTRKKQKA